MLVNTSNSHKNETHYTTAQEQIPIFTDRSTLEVNTSRVFDKIEEFLLKKNPNQKIQLSTSPSLSSDIANFFHVVKNEKGITQEYLPTIEIKSSIILGTEVIPDALSTYDHLPNKEMIEAAFISILPRISEEIAEIETQKLFYAKENTMLPNSQELDVIGLHARSLIVLKILRGQVNSSKAVLNAVKSHWQRNLWLNSRPEGVFAETNVSILSHKDIERVISKISFQLAKYAQGGGRPSFLNDTPEIMYDAQQNFLNSIKEYLATSSDENLKEGNIFKDALMERANLLFLPEDRNSQLYKKFHTKVKNFYYELYKERGLLPPPPSPKDIKAIFMRKFNH
jgi:hypothetical protein